MEKYKIIKNQAGKRLDKFLVTKLDFSRSQIQKLIKENKILVNNKKVIVHYFLKERDEIEIRNQSRALGIENREVKNNTLLNKIKIIAETENYLVINKPAGLLAHTTENNSLVDKKEITLVDWLLKKYPEIKNVWDTIKSLHSNGAGKKNKTGKIRPGIVHRLDRDVSGLMIIAKTQKAFNHLKKQFQDREIKKIYQALVHNEIETEQGIIKRPIARSKKTGLMISKSTVDAKAKEAVTEFEVLQKFINYTLLKINLKTGRTHQIRVHFKSIGHSVVGDTLYATRDVKLKKQKIDLNRIFLCATKLGFIDLEKKWQEFEIKLPQELKNILKELKS